MNCLIFGGGGAIGSSCAEYFQELGYSVWITSRRGDHKNAKIVKITGDQSLDMEIISGLPKFDAVVWAQGTNLNDSILNLDIAQFENLFQANTTFVLSTLQLLIIKGRLNEGSRLCVVSSIWQEIIRSQKLSYSISKAALSALVKSVALDLSIQNIYINAVLPGVLDTPMTRSMLSKKQIELVQSTTGFNRLVTPREIAEVVHFLCSNSNRGITGQSITVDLGFSNVKQI